MRLSRLTWYVTRGPSQFFCDSAVAPETWHQIPHHKEFEGNQETFTKASEGGNLLPKKVPVFEFVQVGFGCE